MVINHRHCFLSPFITIPSASVLLILHARHRPFQAFQILSGFAGVCKITTKKLEVFSIILSVGSEQG